MATRNAINVLIKLLGGAEMTAELKQLGTTGEAAIKKIDDAAKNVSFANLGGALHNFGSDIVSTFERVAVGIGAVSAAVGAAAPFILELAKSGAEAAQQAGDAAKGAGLQADAYQKLAFAAGEADVSQANFNIAMNAFNKQIVKTSDEATKGAGKIGGAFGKLGVDIKQGVGYTTQAFADIGVEVTRFGGKTDKLKQTATAAKTGFDLLGISVRNSSGTLKSNEQLLLEVANAFQKMPDGANKSAIALKLFGLEGAKLIPFLNEGAKGIQALEDEAAKLGIVFSDDQIKAAEAFNNSLSELKKTTAGLSRQVGLIFAPAFTAAANAFRDVIVRNRVAILDFVKNGVQAATVFIKDFFAVLSGRDSDVTSNKWLIDWRNAIVGFGSDFVHVATGVVIPAMQKVHEAADLLTGAINGIFGTNITTGELLIGASLIRIIGGFRLLYSAVVVVVEAISSMSLVLLANPWLAAIAAVAGGIALWATRTSEATAALRVHEELIGQVGSAYDEAGRKVAAMTQELRNQALITARISQDSANKGLAAAIQEAIDKIGQFEGLLPHAADELFKVFDQFKATGDVDAFVASVRSIGAAHPELGVLAQQFLDIAANAKKLSTDSKESADFISLLSGKMTDAQFAAAQAGRGIAGYGQEAVAAAADTKAAGAAVDETKAKVESLGQTITVFRGGGPGGQLSKEVFDVVDGVAHRADQSKAALDGVAASAATAASNVKNVSSEVTNSIAAVPAAIDPNAASSAVDGIVTDVNKLAPAAQEAAGGINSALGTIDAGSAEQAATAVVTPFESLPGKISTIMSGLQGLIQGGFSSLSSIVTSLAAQINSQIASILSALREAAAAAANLRAQAASSSSSSSGGGSQGGFASGGHVLGAGGPKSDSILAMLSNGEFVIQAAAVKRFGVGFLNAINNGVLPSLNSLKGFNIGGIVESFNRSMSIPRLATGGMVPIPAGRGGSSGRPLFLQLPDGSTARGTIEEGAVSQLQRFAIQAGLLSTGRKPRRGK